MMGTPLLPSVQTHNKKTGPCSNGALLLSLRQTDRETQVLPLTLMVTPCWQTQNPGNSRSDPAAVFTKKRSKTMRSKVKDRKKARKEVR